MTRNPTNKQDSNNQQIYHQKSLTIKNVANPNSQEYLPNPQGPQQSANVSLTPRNPIKSKNQVRLDFKTKYIQLTKHLNSTANQQKYHDPPESPKLQTNLITRNHNPTTTQPQETSPNSKKSFQPSLTPQTQSHRVSSSSPTKSRLV